MRPDDTNEPFAAVIPVILQMRNQCFPQHIVLYSVLFYWGVWEGEGPFRIFIKSAVLYSVLKDTVIFTILRF
jgi:hypothetical protein